MPLTVYAWVRLVYKFQTYPAYSFLFGLGVFLFILLARTTIAQSTFATRIIELERDLTQFVLAWAMLHPVVGYGKNDKKGSRIRWLGRGNWIMLAAPYFLPTSTVALWLVSLILFQSFRCLILGFGISYHLAAVLIQYRAGTSELRRLGRKFCWMFLPAINFLVAGCVAAFALNGLTSIGDFLYDWISLPQLIINWLWTQLNGNTVQLFVCLRLREP